MDLLITRRLACFCLSCCLLSMSNLQVSGQQATPLSAPGFDNSDVNPLKISEGSLSTSAEADAEPIDAPELEPLGLDNGDRTVDASTLYEFAVGLFESDDWLESINGYDIPKQGSMAIQVREVQATPITFRAGPDQEVAMMKSQVVYRIQQVDPHAEGLTPEQRLGVVIALQEKELQEQLQELWKDNSEEEQAKKLAELKRYYNARFLTETLYQEYKVRQIEDRARKLREEVEKRKAATDEWVDAMVTLAKMQASGIAPLPRISPGGGIPTTGEPLPGSTNSPPAFLPPSSASQTFEGRFPTASGSSIPLQSSPVPSY